MQALVATHQKTSDQIKKDNIEAGGKYVDGFSGSVPDCIGQYFGHSTDVFYRTGDIDGAKNFAGNAQVGYKAETFGVNLEYRFRGAQASMLYVRENHDDGTFDLSETLGVLNSQRIGFNGFVKPLDELNINLGVTVEMPLEKLAADDAFVTGYKNNLATWYESRHLSEMTPLFGIESGIADDHGFLGRRGSSLCRISRFCRGSAVAAARQKKQDKADAQNQSNRFFHKNTFFLL